MIRVLIVEDSPVVREFLVYTLALDPDIKVVGTANDGEEAIEAVQRLHPDIVTMDIHMPKMDGLEATRRIMETVPTPIIIVSGTTEPDDVATSLHAVESGALAMLQRPTGIGHPDHERTVRELLQTVKLMAEVKVVRRWPKSRRETAGTLPVKGVPAIVRQRVEVVALGASTGGPPVLKAILAGLPRDFSVPIVVVQHMAHGFLQGFVEWLAHYSLLPVMLATHGDYLSAGHVYVAPDGFQMTVTRTGRLMLERCEFGMGLCPSVAYLFHSLAETYGNTVVAGLLTGMGHDGAEELKLLRDAGAFTFAQDKDSSVVYGMPWAAVQLGAVMAQLAPEKIAPLLVNMLRNGGRLESN